MTTEGAAADCAANHFRAEYGKTEGLEAKGAERALKDKGLGAEESATVKIEMRVGGHFSWRDCSRRSETALEEQRHAAF